MNLNMNLRDQPLSICLVSMVLVSLGYLVYIHPQEFELFVNVVLSVGFIILVGLLIASYKPFMRYYQEYLNTKSIVTEVRPHIDYHKQLQENTKKQVDQLMKSQKYQIYQNKKQQNPNTPVILCHNRTEQEINQQARCFEEKEPQIFQQNQPVNPNNGA